MLGARLNELLRVGELADTSLMAGALTLAPDEAGGTLAIYPGFQSTSGAYRIPEAVIDRPVSVAAKDARSLASLFDDEDEVLLKRTESALTLVSRARRVRLRYIGAPDVEKRQLLNVESFFSIPKASFAEEISIASSAATLAIRQDPIATSVRLVFAKDRMLVQSLNGFSMAYVAVTRNGTMLKEQEEMLVPPKHVMKALDLIPSENVLLATSNSRSLILRSDDSETDCALQVPLISGKFPDLRPLAKVPINERAALSTKSLRMLIRASSVLAADALVTIRPGKEHGIILETAESEQGHYQDLADGSITRPYTFDVRDLEVAAKIAGEELDVFFGQDHVYVNAQSDTGERRLYINLRRPRA